MSDFKPGTMDTTEQHKTFDNFVSIVTKMTIAILVFLVLLAMVNG